LPLLHEILHRYCPSNAKILDLACGTGVLAEKLSLEGYRVMGIDISPQMIQVAKSRANYNTSFEVHNMIDYQPDSRFDLVICTFDALNYLSSLTEVKKVIQNVYTALINGGTFLFDFNTERLFKYLHNGIIHRKINGEEFIQYRNYDSITRIATTRFLFSDGTNEVHMQRAYESEEIQELLHQAGFTIIHSYGGFQGEPFTEQSYRYIGVVRKIIRKVNRKNPGNRNSRG